MLSSVEERYSWTSGKMRAMCLLCLFFLIVTVLLYAFDVYTDVDFSEEMYRIFLHGPNYTTEVDDCKMVLSPIVDNITTFCKSDFDGPQCTDASKALTTALGRNCSELSSKLESVEWLLARWVCLAHVIAPAAFIFLFTLISIRALWVSFQEGVHKRIYKFLYHHSGLSSTSRCITNLLFPLYFIWNLPFPFLTKLRQTRIEWTKYSLFTKRAEMDKAEFDEVMEKKKEEEEEIQKAELFSIVAETGLESNFQFWFQTQFILPGLVANILDYTNDQLGLTDLFNFRVFSILLSFVSISWTAVKIRLVFIKNYLI